MEKSFAALALELVSLKKSQIKAYVRKDGTSVKAHSDKRSKKAAGGRTGLGSNVGYQDVGALRHFNGGGTMIFREKVEAALDKTGVPYTDFAHNGHIQFRPASNLKPWTEAEENKLIAACKRNGLSVTKDIVTPDFQTKKVGSGQGFRIYFNPNENK